MILSINNFGFDIPVYVPCIFIHCLVVLPRSVNVFLILHSLVLLAFYSQIALTFYYI